MADPGRRFSPAIKVKTSLPTARCGSATVSNFDEELPLIWTHPRQWIPTCTFPAPYASLWPSSLGRVAGRTEFRSWRLPAPKAPSLSWFCLQHIAFGRGAKKGEVISAVVVLWMAWQQQPPVGSAVAATTRAEAFGLGKRNSSRGSHSPVGEKMTST
jgi:hypothetical protein